MTAHPVQIGLWPAVVDPSAAGLPRLTRTPTHCGTLAMLSFHDRRYVCMQCQEVIAVYVACGDDDGGLWSGDRS